MRSESPASSSLLPSLAIAGLLLATVFLLRSSDRAGRLHTARTQRSQFGTCASPTPQTASKHPGVQASYPAEIPVAGWISILRRTYQQISVDRLDLLAAGVTFYALLALFPAIAAIVSIYGLFADRATVIDHVGELNGLLPQGAIEIITAQLDRVVSQPDAALGLGFAFGLALSFWGANKATKSVFSALNAAYGESETRNFFRLNLVSLVYTFGSVLLVILALGVIVVAPIVIAYIGANESAKTAISLLRWPILLAVVLTSLSLLYRYGPSRTAAKWRWVTPGSILTSVVWLAASILFSWYVANFGGYNETYGSLGAVIVFMTWFWLSITVVLVGAELNAEAERQTAQDSTIDPARPMGERGAFAADTLAKSR